MPKLRTKVLVDDETESQESYTMHLDLPSAGKLSTLWLGVKANSVVESGETSAFIKYLVSSISVNQGGQAALNAAPPEVFQADYWAKTGKWPQCGKHLGEDASENIEEIVPIMFGEVVNDPNHYIDLSKMSDPKLSVIYDTGGTGPNSGELWRDGYYPKFTVVADLMSGPDLPPSKGYHSLRQKAQYTPADSQIKKLELRGSRPIRNILFQFDRKSLHYGVYSSIDGLKLDGKNGEYVPFDLDDRELHLLHRRAHGLCEVTGKFDYVYVGANMDAVVDYREANGIVSTDNENVWAMPVGGSGRQLPIRKFESGADPADLTTITAYFRFLGYYPWSIFNLDIPKMLGLESLKPDEHDPLFFEIDHVSNAATIGGPVKIHTVELAPPLGMQG